MKLPVQDTINVTLTKKQAAYVANALEVFARLRVGQLTYAVEQTHTEDVFFGKKDIAEELRGLEDSYRSLLTENSKDGNSFTKEDIDSMIWDLKCILTQFVSVVNNDGWWDDSRSLIGPISNEIKTDFKDYIDLPIDNEAVITNADGYDVWSRVHDHFKDHPVYRQTRAYRWRIVETGKSSPRFALRMYRPQKRKDDECFL
jgi:hypothetical protein